MKHLYEFIQGLGFASAVIGIAGMPGAIEFGTGYLTPSVFLIGGALMVYVFRN